MTQAQTQDWKLELIAVPVSDIDRAKDFYVKIGFNADHDHTVSDEVRFVQLTPRARRARSCSTSTSARWRPAPSRGCSAW